MDFGALPPEINSARMYAGPGPVSMSAAALAWENLATELHSAASSYRTVVAGLTTGRWMGPSSLTMASAFGPYVAWTVGAAARAAEAAGQARLAVEAYEVAFAMTVPPPVVTANRVQLATLVATNFFGQNSPAIAANEAAYGEMWAQDALAMYQYAANSAAACDVTPFGAPPEVVNPAGVAQQSSAVAAQSTLAAGDSQWSLANLVAAVPNTLQALTSPVSNLLLSNPTIAATLTGFETQLPYALPTYFMAAATPLYGMSSVLGIAQTSQSLGNAAAAGAAGAAAAAEGAAAGVASAASSGAGALGAGLASSVGTATTLGPLSVPASWTSVIPTAHVSSITPLPNAGVNGSPNLLGGLPSGRGTSSRTPPLPRYGVVPTAMTRPPSAG